MFVIPSPLPAAPSASSRRPLVLDAGLSGSWEDTDDGFKNRASVNAAAFGLSVRAAANDARGPMFADLGEGTTDYAFGAYHARTASRFVYGALEQSGLTRRISSPFGRNIPLADDHKAAEVDMESDAPIGRDPSLYAALGTPRRFPLRAHAGLLLERNKDYVATATAEASGGHGSFIRLDGAYAHESLAEREADAWFSEVPPLPDRLLRVYSAAFVASSSIAAAAVDGAISDAYAEGAGAYGNAALRLGNAPWRLCFAADGATHHYRGPDGDPTGVRFRSSTRIEHAAGRTRGNLVRADFRTSHPASSSPPDEIEAALSLRRGGHAPMRLKRAAISGEWAIAEGEPLIDAAETYIGMVFGPLEMTTSLRTTFEAGPDGLGGRLWDASTLRAHLSVEFGPLEVRAGAGRTFTADDEGVTEASCGASLSLRRMRFGLKLSFEEVPGPAVIGLSWRIRHRSSIPFPSGGTS